MRPQPTWPAKPQLQEPFTVERVVPLMDEAGVDRSGDCPRTGPAETRSAGAAPAGPGLPDRDDRGDRRAGRRGDDFRVMGEEPEVDAPVPCHAEGQERRLDIDTQGSGR